MYAVLISRANIEPWASCLNFYVESYVRSSLRVNWEHSRRCLLRCSNSRRFLLCPVSSVPSQVQIWSQTKLGSSISSMKTIFQMSSNSSGHFSTKWKTFRNKKIPISPLFLCSSRMSRSVNGWDLRIIRRWKNWTWPPCRNTVRSKQLMQMGRSLDVVSMASLTNRSVHVKWFARIAKSMF